jgi:hypothetical protein
MKLKPEHYNHILTEFNNLGKEALLAMYETAYNDNRVKDIITRASFDALYAAKLSPWVCDNLYSYCDDTHIETAVRKAFKQVTAL